MSQPNAAQSGNELCANCKKPWDSHKGREKLPPLHRL
jgi:hypothetical protein